MIFKRILMLLVFSVLCISLSAQFASFRSLSTAGLIDDNIEAILAVTEMPYVDGFNIFTNLSNFNYQSERIFFNGASNNYLVGFKGSIMDMFHLGFLSKSYGYSDGDSTNVISTTYIDNNGDEQYDEFDTYITDDIVNSGGNNSTNFLAFTFGKPQGVKAGLSYTNYRGINDTNEFITEVSRDSNMISGDILRLYNYWYDYNYVNPFTENSFTFNGAFSTENIEIATNIGIGLFKDNYTYNESDSFFEDLTPSGTGTTENVGYDISSYNYTQNGFNWNLGLKTYYRMNEDTFEFGGYFSNTNYEKTPYFEDNVYFNQSISPGIVDDQIYSYKYSSSLGDSISTFVKSYLDWRFGGKFVKKLEKAHFAMGLILSQSKYFYVDTMSYNYRIDRFYDNGDGLRNTTDYTYLETGTYTLEYAENGLSTILHLPVGIEYNFWGPLSGRLGAETYLIWDNDDTSLIYLAFDPGTQIFTYGDGSVYETLNDTISNRGDSFYQYHGFSRYTSFSYGIGWDISKNVKIDLMGFSNLTSLVNWSISANVKI